MVMTICQMDLGREGWGWVVWQDRRGGSEISEAKPEKRGLLPGVRKGREAIWDAGGEVWGVGRCGDGMRDPTPLLAL